LGGQESDFMRIIVAGGSGLIGRELSLALLTEGNEVTILSRDPGKVTGMPGGIKILQWDGRQVQEWGKEMENIDVVINLVGENLSGKGLLPSRWTKERKERLLRSRVDAGKVLTKAIEMVDKKPAVFIQASGIGIYGKHFEGQFTEESELGNDFLANLSKQWEASSEPVEALGVRRVVIRNGVVLSTTGGALRPLLLPYRFFIGGPIGNGRQVYSWIHIDDEVNAIRFLIEHDQARGVFNLSSPNPVTNNEFGKTISKVMRRPHYLPIPSFFMRLAFGEVASMVLEGQSVLPTKLLDEGYVFIYPKLVEALSDLLKK
jgi:uncharacterized protein (TIGR01777 family)